MDPVLNFVGRHLTKEKMHLVSFFFLFVCFCFSEAVLCVTAPGIIKQKEFHFHIQINYEASESAAFKMYSRVFLSGGS